MRTLPALITAVAAVLGSASAHAQQGPDATADLVRQNVVLEQRIEHGVRTGLLSPREAAQLTEQANQVYRLEAEALEDGRLGRRETRNVYNAQADLARAIERQRLDGERADPRASDSLHLQAQLAQRVARQARIEEGVERGRLSNSDVADLQWRQVARAEDRANGRNRWNDRRDDRWEDRTDPRRGDLNRDYSDRYPW